MRKTPPSAYLVTAIDIMQSCTPARRRQLRAMNFLRNCLDDQSRGEFPTRRPRGKPTPKSPDAGASIRTPHKT